MYFTSTIFNYNLMFKGIPMKNSVYLASLVTIGLIIPMTSHAFDQSSPPNSLVVDTAGRVGMGTAVPSTGLNIIHSNGTAIIKVQEKSGTTNKRYQVQLENNGGTGFLFRDTSVDGREWQVATLSNGSFATSFIGTGGAEMEISAVGRVKMGPGAATNFDLQATGNLIIPNGTVTATNFVTSSSHTVKKDFEKVDADAVMDKLQQLEVTKWRYKDPQVKGQHIGPMAEEFYQLFELGPDERHVSGTDMASVALIAVKELQKKSDRFASETTMLKAENADLKQRLLALEKLVTNLASGDGTLTSNGEKVALNK